MSYTSIAYLGFILTGSFFFLLDCAADEAQMESSVNLQLSVLFYQFRKIYCIYPVQYPVDLCWRTFAEQDRRWICNGKALPRESKKRVQGSYRLAEKMRLRFHRIAESGNSCLFEIFRFPG